MILIFILAGIILYSATVYSYMHYDYLLIMWCINRLFIIYVCMHACIGMWLCIDITVCMLMFCQLLISVCKLSGIVWSYISLYVRKSNAVYTHLWRQGPLPSNVQGRSRVVTTYNSSPHFKAQLGRAEGASLPHLTQRSPVKVVVLQLIGAVHSISLEMLCNCPSLPTQYCRTLQHVKGVLPYITTDVLPYIAACNGRVAVYCSM